MLHHGKTKLRRGGALSPHVVTLSTFGMLSAKEVVPPVEATDAPGSGWHVKRRAIEDGVKRSLLHLRCWHRLVVACSDPNPNPPPLTLPLTLTLTRCRPSCAAHCRCITSS